ncbi:MAG: F0F1 ATP synthase subunit B [Pirellulales bacterium]|nr:F0F1 ATP synthase subunit B [Pirellulales bacterium]
MWNRVFTCLLAVAIGLAIASPILASESAAAEDGGMNPFSLSAWETDLALWTAIVFLCLVAILWKFAWGPLAAALDKREQKIADDIAGADDANQQAKELLEQHQKKLDEVGDEVRGILEQGRREAEQLGRVLIEKAKKDAELEQQRALGRIETATDDALKGLADRSAAMAVELAGRIVREKLDPKDHTRLIEQTVAGFGREKAES